MWRTKCETNYFSTLKWKQLYTSGVRTFSPNQFLLILGPTKLEDCHFSFLYVLFFLSFWWFSIMTFYWTDIQMPLFLSAKSYCHPNPCLHGGKCVDNKNGYACSCIGSYRGINCEGIELFVTDAKNNLSVASSAMFGNSRHTVPTFANYLFIIELQHLTITGRGWAKYRDLSAASRSIICRSRRLRQIIYLRDTDKSRYFAITEFNNCFIIRSPSLFSYFNHFLTAQGSDLPFSS